MGEALPRCGKRCVSLPVVGVCIGFFWSTVGISSVATVFASSRAAESTICRMWLVIGTGIQMVASLALAYVIMGGGEPGFLPLLVASALMEMYFVRTSLSVNQLSAYSALWRGCVCRQPNSVRFLCRHASTGVVCCVADRGTS